MATADELLDILMKDYKKPEDLIGENGLLKQLTVCRQTFWDKNRLKV